MTEHNVELSVASNPAKSNISAKQRDIQRLRCIVVLSPRNPKKTQRRKLGTDIFSYPNVLIKR